MNVRADGWVALSRLTEDEVRWPTRCTRLHEAAPIATFEVSCQIKAGSLGAPPVSDRLAFRMDPDGGDSTGRWVRFGEILAMNKRS